MFILKLLWNLKSLSGLEGGDIEVGSWDKS